MALAKYGGMIIELVGSIAGNVYFNTQAGPAVRAWGCKPNRRTVLQNEVRVLVQKLQKEWQDVSDDDRELWNRLAAYRKVGQKNGTGHFINAHQLFIQSNFYRLRYNQPLLTTPSFTKGDVLPVTCTVALDPFIGDLIVTLDRIPNGVIEFIVIEASQRVPPTRNNAQGLFRQMIFSTSSLPLQNITAAYESVFGRKATTGDTIFVRCAAADKDTGAITTFFEVKTTLV